MSPASRSPDRLRVLVVDDHDVVHWGFRLMLTQQSWVERCVTASTGDEAVELAVRYRPHVAVVDLFIGEESGAEVCERVRSAVPGTRVLLFSGAGEISPHAARAAGASGFAHKDWPARKIAGAVRLVGLGGTVFERQEPTPAMGLTERERSVLELMGAGATNPENNSRFLLSGFHALNVIRQTSVSNHINCLSSRARLKSIVSLAVFRASAGPL